MHDLEITWPEGQARFSPDDSPVQIGRSPDAAIILTEPSVSRRHIEFIWTGSAWNAADSSTHGSFDPIGVRLAPNWTVGTNTTIRLGGVEGVEVRIELVTTRPEGFDPHVGAPPPPVVADQPPAPPGLDDVAGLDAPPPRPAFDAPPPAPSFDAAPPSRPSSSPTPPSVFDVPPPSEDIALGRTEPQAPSPHPPPSYDQPPVGGAPSHEAPPPGAPPAPDQPSVEVPSATEMAPPAYDPPAYPPPQPAEPSAFDAPPSHDAPPQPAEPSAFDAPPSHDAPPQPAEPSAFDAPPGDEQPHHPEGAPPPYEQPAYPPPEAAPSAFDAPPGYDQPQEPGPGQPPGYDAPGSPPGGAVTGLATTTAISDATIQLSIDGRDYTFLPGTEVTVGRDPSCLVTVDERHSLVSRRHLKITYRDANWWIEDFSSKGTFIDGKRISSAYRAEGAFMAQLGDDDAGAGLRVITAGEHRAPRKQGIALLLAIGLLALLAIAALALALRGGNDPATETSSGVPTPAETAAQPVENAAAANLTAAKQATVLLLAEEGIGSGFFV
ncbi:MAG: FHA domain-containing protein, partial [Acidimicrobiia bacterium]|nr:FHA domain-containing protein [Acidimicrobiia bacterium]